MSPAAPPCSSTRSALVHSLALREAYRETYWREHDPITDDRLLWRAQSFRHSVHLLPEQTILELGSGSGLFTRALSRVTRGENPITAATFSGPPAPSPSGAGVVEHLTLDDLPGPLEGRQFDCIVALDLLDGTNAPELLPVLLRLLRPGGEILFYESNPWNPVLNLRRLLARLSGHRDPRRLMNRPQLYELLSAIGFVRIYAAYNDFVFPPLTRPLIWLLRPLSTLLENMPFVRRMAGSILLHAQKPAAGASVPPGVPPPVYAELRGAVSVVIPCRNEDMNVGPLVRRLLALYGAHICEVILVNDGSTDGTAAVMEELAADDARVRPLHRSPPHGVGHAIAAGLRAATGRFVLTMDCDFIHLLPEFRDLLEAAARGHEVVIGSRFSRHSVLLNYPFPKIAANRLFHLVARVLLWRRFRDVTNNLKIMRHDVVRRLRLRQGGFAVNAETGLQPILMGYRVKEVPISWIDRTPGMGTSSFRLLQVGGGYWSVLLGLWLGQRFQRGPYVELLSPDPPGAAHRRPHL